MAARSHVTDTGRTHTCRRGPPWHGVALAAPDGWEPSPPERAGAVCSAPV